MGLFDELKKLTKPYDDEDDDDFEEDFNPRASERIPIPQVQAAPPTRNQYQAAGRSSAVPQRSLS